MVTLERFRTRRLLTRIACLALFLAGSNTCLLGSWGGHTAMACLTLPSNAAQAPRCHHCAPPRSGQETMRRSCCPAPVVTPADVTLDRDADGPSPLALAISISDALPFASAWHGHRALPDGRPPTRLARAPLPARAPPLA